MQLGTARNWLLHQPSAQFSSAAAQREAGYRDRIRLQKWNSQRWNGIGGTGRVL